MTKRTKIFFITTGVLACLFVLLLIGISFYLNMDRGQRWIQSMLNQSIPGKLSWEEGSFSLLNGKIELNKILLKTPHDKNVAALDRFLVDASLTGLLKGELILESMVLEKPQVWLTSDRKGNLDLAQALITSGVKAKAPDSSPGGFPFNLVLKSFTLSRGYVQYSMIRNAKLQRVKVFDINLNAQEGNLLEQSIKLSLEIGKGEIDVAGINTDLKKLKFEVALDKGRIKPISLELDSNIVMLKIFGDVERPFSSPLVNLDINLKTSLEEIRNTLRIKPELSGPVHLHFTGKGPLDNPEAVLNLSYGGGSLAGIGVNSLNLICSLKDKKIIIKDLNINTPMSNLTATGNIDLQKAFAHFLTPSQWDLKAITYKFFIKQPKSPLNKLLPVQNTEIGGSVHSTLTVEGKGISLETLSAKAKLEISAENLSVKEVLDPINFKLSAQADLSRQVVSLKRLDLNNANINAGLKGSFDLSSQKVAATMDLNVQDLAKIPLSTGTGGLSGKVAMKTDITGFATKPVINTKIEGDHLRYKQINIGKLIASASLNRSGKVHISNLMLDSEGSTVKAKGTIEIFDESMKINPDFPADILVLFNNLHLNHYVKQEGISGKLDGALTVQGTLKAPRSTLKIKGKSLSTQSYNLGDLEADIRFEGGKLSLTPAKLNRGKSQVNASGSVQLLNPLSGQILKKPILDIKITSEALFLEDFMPDMKGKFTLNGEVSGDPNNLMGKVSLTGNRIDTGVQTIDKVILNSHFKDDRINIDSLLINIAQDESIQVDGWISPLNKNYELQAVSKAISLDSIGPLKKNNFDKEKLFFNIAGKGSLDNPLFSGELGLGNIGVKEQHPDDILFRVALQNRVLRVSGDNHFNLDSWLNIDTKDFSAMVRFDKTDLTPFMKMAGRENLKGSITAKIEAKGNATLPEKVHALADVSQLDILLNDKPLVHTQNIKIALHDEKIKISKARLALFQQGHLDIEGTGDIKGKVDLLFKGALPMRVFNGFNENLQDLEGRVMLNADVQGLVSKPDIQAEIILEKIGFTLPELGQKLHDLNGRIQISSQKALLNNIKGKLDEGDFAIDGEVVLKNFLPSQVALNIDARQLPIKVPDALDLLLNAQIKVNGKEDKSKLEGEIVILKGLYYKDVSLSLADVTGKSREETPGSVEPPHPLLKNMELDIVVRRKGEILVDNNIALMRLTPQIRIFGKVGNPLVSGRTSVDSGVLTFQKKEFEIKKGVVDFINPYKIEPTVQVQSKTEVRDWTIFLDLSGTPENLIFKLTSKPPEEQGDILSLLVLGKTTGELIKSDNGSSVSPEQILAGMVATSLAGDVREATGLDIVEVEFKEGDQEQNSEDVRVTLGKELSKRMAVKFTAETKDGGMVQRVTTDYKFFENLMMSVFRDTTGIFGGELKLRMEFQ